MRKINRLMINQKGFTLVEIMVVTGLLSVMIIALYSVTSYSQALFYNQNAYAQLTQGTAQTLRTVMREVGQSSPNTTPNHLDIVTDGSGNSVLTFQIPVDWDNDGDAFSGSLTPVMEWGAYDSVGSSTNGRLNDWVAYYVNNTSQLIREIRNGGGVAYANTARVVSSNVQNFLVTQSGEQLRMVLTLRLVNTVGQAGGARTQTQTFTTETLLRNAVD
jgi:prepilin-type N-terminal cleavage/methylation domain-containing protein